MIVAGYYGITLAIRVSSCMSVRLSGVRQSVFSFPDDNLSKCQWIFTKLGVCIDIVEIWLGTVNGQILSVFDRDLPMIRPYFHFRMINLVNINGFSPIGVCIDIVKIWFEVADVQISSNFDRVIYLRHVHIFISGR